MRETLVRLFVLFAAVSGSALLVPRSGLGQEEHDGAHAAAEAGHDGEHAFHRNELAVFVGASVLTKYEDDPTSFTVGGEYFRRLSERTSIGITVEYADGDLERDWVVLVPVGYRPFDGWAEGFQFVIGPGLEFASLSEEAVEELEGGEGGAGHEAEAEASGADEREEETDFVIRLGVDYVLELGRISLTPQVNADVVGDHVTWVAGVALGLGF
jgi:hypothetical protein